MSRSRYTITITEQTQEKKIVGGEWKLIGTSGADKHGYTPEIEATRDVERVLYVQNLDAIDLSAIIAAVNDL